MNIQAETQALRYFTLATNLFEGAEEAETTGRHDFARECIEQGLALLASAASLVTTLKGARIIRDSREFWLGVLDGWDFDGEPRAADCTCDRSIGYCPRHGY